MQDESRHHAPVAAFCQPGEPWRAPLQTDWYRGIALSGFNPAPLSIIQFGGVARLEVSRTKRPRLVALPQGEARRWARGLESPLGRTPVPSRDRINPSH